MNLGRFAAAAAVSVAILSACGGSPAATVAPATATPAQASGTDVCALLTTRDLNSVTRKGYQSGIQGSVDQCSWEGDQLAEIVGGPGDLLIGELTETDMATIKTTFGAGGKDETVADHAAFYNPTEGVASLWVETDTGQLLVLTFPSLGELDARYETVLIELAEKALAKIQS